MNNRWLPLVLCGDFNSTPDSAVYSLLCTGSVPAGHPDLRIDPEHMLPPHHMLAQPLRLDSAYRVVLGREPELTNYTSSYKGVLDYVLLQNATPEAVLEAPSTTDLHGPMPSPHHPSDHIPLVVDVALQI